MGINCPAPPQPPSVEVVATQKKHKGFEIAQRVTITEQVSPIYKGAIGKIIGKIYLGRNYTRYQVQFDKKSRGQQLIVVEIP